MQSESFQEALEVFRATPAYEEAVFDLLVCEAQWIAERLGINDAISADRGDAGPPGPGVSGSVCGDNYAFSFIDGRFQQVRWHDWSRKISPPLDDLLEFSRRSSQLDSNSALELARSWLKALGIDLDALAGKCIAKVFHVPANSARETPPGQPRLMRPQFIITWTDSSKTALGDGRRLPSNIPPRPGALITVEILGTTKQLIELGIAAPNLLPRPKLELKDADRLLGPEPAPAELMAKILTRATYETIKAPDVIEAWLLTSNRNSRAKRDRAGPVKLGPELAKKLSIALLNFDSYDSWSFQKGCVTDDGVRLRLGKGDDEVHIRFCFECDILTISRAGVEQSINFDQGHYRFADLVLEIFPGDSTIRGLPRRARPTR